jgi:uncharacterized protein
VPVVHDACTQSSDEECAVIVRIVEELLGRREVDDKGIARPMEPRDILIVAPFNLQVRCLKQRRSGDPGGYGRQVPGAGGPQGSSTGRARSGTARVLVSLLATSGSLM